MPRTRWLMIFLCFLATTINYVDRATLAVAAPFMREDLHIDPAVMGGKPCVRGFRVTVGTVLGFLAAGVVSVAYPSLSPALVLGSTFGGFHLIYALVLLVRPQRS